MLNTFGVIRLSQIGLPASSINWQQHPEQSCHTIKPPRALYANHSPHRFLSISDYSYAFHQSARQIHRYRCHWS
jgi:hypothetical protein